MIDFTGSQLNGQSIRSAFEFGLLKSHGNVPDSHKISHEKRTASFGAVPIT